ncbi:alanine aminotransferase 1 [Chanos chanos]|uniref:alanine transaminase n=1 Tax=Chanos chanos TaxID=29144 RepID=A0A6J2V4K3_CHACN|nr:alanine aminotransferase 1-like [Chanos chanos]
MSVLREIKQSAEEEVQRHLDIIRRQILKGVTRPYNEVIDLSSGDNHAAGIKPITFVRQVLAGCLYPDVLLGDTLPVDAQLRVKRLLEQCAGGSVGSYTDSSGMAHVQRNVANFISRRDGGLPADPNHVFIASGSQRAIMAILKLLPQGEGTSQTGIMVPTPCPHTLPHLLKAAGLVTVPYQLTEEMDWKVDLLQLHKVIQASRGHCSPRALFISNPGNPTGHIQSRRSIEQIICFAAEHKLLLLVDEKYQESVFGEGSEFVSYKKVLAEIGPPYSLTVELASFHSLSNGIMGECGLRAGYVELVNFDHTVLPFVETLLCRDISTPVLGQIALDIMVGPPLPGDPSYNLYTQEVESRRATLECNMDKAVDCLNTLPGFRCHPVKAGLFIYPHLTLPNAVLTQAQHLGVEAGLLYCGSLLEEEGLCVGVCECVCESSRQGSCWHIRMCVLMPSDVLEDVLCRLRSFHIRFLRGY